MTRSTKHPATNIHKAVDQEFGNVEDAFKAAASMPSAQFKFEGISHGFTEPHSVLAHWDADDRLSQLYTPQQVPHYTHRALAKVLQLPMHQIQVSAPWSAAASVAIRPVPARNDRGTPQQKHAARSK
ncbi:MAG: molybdopterin cofactor-binding domain-containing protein [Planctomycetota bacterium]